MIDPRSAKTRRYLVNHLFSGNVQQYDEFLGLFDAAVKRGSAMPYEAAIIAFRDKYRQVGQFWSLKKTKEELEEGGAGSGNFGHAGRPGERGGSAEGGGGEANASVLNSATMSDSSTGSAKKWARENQERYNTDKEFQLLSDLAVHFTQGNYQHLRIASMFVGMSKEEFEAALKVLPGQTLYNEEWLTKLYDGSATFKDLSNPGDQYKVFEGQDLQSGGSLREAARALNEAIDRSEIRTEPIYRGVPLNTWSDAGKAVLELKEGDSFSIKGATSFTTDPKIAEGFAFLKLGGGRGISKYDASHTKSVVFKIENPKAVNVSQYSHWRQKEVVTRGNYKVKSIDYSKKPLEIVLEQVHETKD